LIYIEEVFEPLVRTLDQMATKGHTKIYFTFKIRLPELTQAFLDLLAEKFSIEYIDVSKVHPSEKERMLVAVKS